jgi:hypothetical protein
LKNETEILYQHGNRRQTSDSKLDKLKVASLIIGIVLIISGGLVSYYGTERQEGTKTQGEFSFGTYYWIDYLTNKTYQGAGTADISNIRTRGDTVEILPVKTPDNFHGNIGNFYYFVWDGGAKANLQGNNPTKIIEASDLPIDYTPSNSEVSFELMANNDNATWNSIVSSNTAFWYGTFVLHHTISVNYVLFASGVIVVICGLVLVPLTTTSLRSAKREEHEKNPLHAQQQKTE